MLAMKPLHQRPFNFDACSVMLFAAITLSGPAALRAQTPSRAPQTQGSPASTAPAPTTPDASQTALKRTRIESDTKR